MCRESKDDTTQKAPRRAETTHGTPSLPQLAVGIAVVRKMFELSIEFITACRAARARAGMSADPPSAWELRRCRLIQSKSPRRRASSSAALACEWTSQHRGISGRAAVRARLNRATVVARAAPPATAPEDPPLRPGRRRRRTCG